MPQSEVCDTNKHHVRIRQTNTCSALILHWCESSPACGQLWSCAAKSPSTQIHSQREAHHPVERSTEQKHPPCVHEWPLKRHNTLTMTVNMDTVKSVSLEYICVGVHMYGVPVSHVQHRNEQSSETVRNSGTPSLQTSPQTVPLWPWKVFKFSTCTNVRRMFWIRRTKTKPVWMGNDMCTWTQ